MREDWPDKRRAEGKLYFHAIERLDKAIDPNWDPNAVGPMPLPPKEAKMGWDGMPPSAIEDPKLRAQYEQSLEEYWARVARDNRQRNLRQMKEDYLSMLEGKILWLYCLYCWSTADEPQLQTHALQKDLKMYVEDPHVRQRILQGVEQRMQKLGKPRPRRKLGPRGQRLGEHIPPRQKEN